MEVHVGYLHSLQRAIFWDLRWQLFLKVACSKEDFVTYTFGAVLVSLAFRRIYICYIRFATVVLEIFVHE